MLIREIEPNDYRGINLLNIDKPESLMERIIESPLLNACKILKNKGIETVMSSANKNNILKPGEKPKEKEDVYGNGQQWFLNHPIYEDAGRGYAWIMLNFQTLSDENREWIFSLEERKGENGEPIGEKAVWFVEPNSFEIFNSKKGVKSPRFDEKKIILGYNDGLYPRQTVILRMPINNDTTVEEVDSYFSKLAESFKTQIPEKKKEVPEDIEP